MTDRQRLPNRRPSLSFDVESQGLRFTCTASWFPDGSLAEVFLQNHKAGSQAGINAQDLSSRSLAGAAIWRAARNNSPCADARLARPRIRAARRRARPSGAGVVMTPEALLARHGIHLECTAPGRHYTTCPKCSAGRRQQNQKEKVLGVTIDGKGARWGCNHCGWTGPEKGTGANNGRQQRPAATYDYHAASGELIFQKVRNPPGHAPRFWCRRPDGKGGWISNTKGIDKKPLYREPEVVEAIKAARTICIVEGEKDADSLWRLDLPATCNFDGAADVTKSPNAKPKWKPEYSERLRDASIVVFNDNDPQGIAHADAACRLSHGITNRVRRLDLAPHWPGMPKGADVSDWLAVGGEHTPERLRELIEAAPDYVPADPAATKPGPQQTNNGDDAVDPLEGLAEKAAADPGAPFMPEVLEALAALKKNDRAAFEALRVDLKRAGAGHRTRRRHRGGKWRGRARAVPGRYPA